MGGGGLATIAVGDVILLASASVDAVWHMPMCRTYRFSETPSVVSILE